MNQIPAYNNVSLVVSCVIAHSGTTASAVAISFTFLFVFVYPSVSYSHCLCFPYLVLPLYISRLTFPSPLSITFSPSHLETAPSHTPPEFCWNFSIHQRYITYHEYSAHMPHMHNAPYSNSGNASGYICEYTRVLYHTHARAPTPLCIMSSCLITIQTSRPNNHNDIQLKCYWSLGNRQGVVSSVRTPLFPTKWEWKSSTSSTKQFRYFCSLFYLFMLTPTDSAPHE